MSNSQVTEINCRLIVHQPKLKSKPQNAFISKSNNMNKKNTVKNHNQNKIKIILINKKN